MEENTNEFPCFVADNSFIVSYILQEEHTEETDRQIKELLDNNGQIYVPQLFWYELGNVLLMNSKPDKKTGIQRISKSEINDIMYDLRLLPIYTDPIMDQEIWTRIFTLAEENNLSYYDASYLELAKRYNIPLKTYDEDLKRAYERVE
ncbi:MAG: type II toxin-antitoxin system VapC family toxin [Treponema sp.]|nr:type II toxin-antitoxin system VapC family toxin [Treponema sp.]